jgi:hypothetical protein
MATTKRSQKTEGDSSNPNRKTSSERGRSLKSSETGATGRKCSGASSAPVDLASRARKQASSVKRAIARHEESEISQAAPRTGSKGADVVDLLNQKNGATMEELAEATGWQAHSVRGFLSGALKKKRSVAVTTHKDDKGQRRYRIAT